MNVPSSSSDPRSLRNCDSRAGAGPQITRVVFIREDQLNHIFPRAQQCSMKNVLEENPLLTRDIKSMQFSNDQLDNLKNWTFQQLKRTTVKALNEVEKEKDQKKALELLQVLLNTQNLVSRKGNSLIPSLEAPTIAGVKLSPKSVEKYFQLLFGEGKYFWTARFVCIGLLAYSFTNLMVEVFIPEKKTHIVTHLVAISVPLIAFLIGYCTDKTYKFNYKETNSLDKKFNIAITGAIILEFGLMASNANVYYRSIPIFIVFTLLLFRLFSACRLALSSRNDTSSNISMPQKTETADALQSGTNETHSGAEQPGEEEKR